MFTGLVEELGSVRAVRPRGDGATVEVAASQVLEGLAVGDSIAINGACQTVVAFDATGFTVEAIGETMQRTRFGSWGPGETVNLERALQPSSRLGGHLVQGHVDTVATLLDLRELEGSWRLRVELPGQGAAYVVEKGSIAIDGISLTVASTGAGWFEVEVIPHSWEQTSLHRLRRGSAVHLEYDIIAKYVRNMLSGYLGERGSDVSLESLLRAGFR